MSPAMIIKKFKDRFAVSDLQVSQAKVTEWLTTPTGRYLYRQESAVSHSEIFKLPGYRALQLGVSPTHSLLEDLLQQHKFIIAPVTGGDAACIGDFEYLPLPSNAIDVVLLHHALDFSLEPHKLLTEVARVVIPGGHIIIIVFDPLSLFGITKWLAGLLSSQPVWRHHSLRMTRVVDWLQLLGFQIVDKQRGGQFKIPGKVWGDQPVSVIEWVKKYISSRAFYVVVARKQVVPLLPAQHTAWPAIKVSAITGLKPVKGHKRK